MRVRSLSVIALAAALAAPGMAQEEVEDAVEQEEAVTEAVEEEAAEAVKEEATESVEEEVSETVEEEVTAEETALEASEDVAEEAAPVEEQEDVADAAEPVEEQEAVETVSEEEAETVAEQEETDSVMEEEKAEPATTQAAATSLDLVSTFQQTCLMPGIDHGDRIQAVEGSDQWQEDEAVSVNFEHLGAARAVGIKPDFRTYTEAKQWSGMIDGRSANVVLVTFPEESRFNHACAILTAGFGEAGHYKDGIYDAFRAFGADYQSVDLYHYFEFAGSVRSGEDAMGKKQRIHGELFSHTEDISPEEISTKDNIHIYVAY